MTSVDISVIIPTYRPQDYLWQCLDSLSNQTLSHTRYEIIIVLNGDEEPYCQDIAKYINKAADVKLIYIYTNVAGVSNARNIGIKKATGRYVCFIDDDDWASANFLESLLSKATDDNIVVSNVKTFDEIRQSYSTDYLGRAYNRIASEEVSSLLTSRSFFSTCCCKLIPRKIIADNCFDTRFKQSEDALFMATISKNVRSIRCAPADTIYFRRIRRGSARAQRSKLKASTDTIPLAAALCRLYLSDIKHYNFLFFLTRVLGLFKNIFRKTC